MAIYCKIALANVRRSVRDYSIYFLTLGCAACLLYLFSASGDYILALDLTPEQRGIYRSSGQIIQAFSVFTVLVFAFLVIYANRFILRRRSREFGLYALLGMPEGAVMTILACEGLLVGAGALIVGIGMGVLVSPLFGAVVSLVFDVPWRLVWTASLNACLWTIACFALVMALATLVGMRTLHRRSLLDLMVAQRAPDHPKAMGSAALWAQIGLGMALVGVVWALCVLQPLQFVVYILPLGVIAVLGTCLVFRACAGLVPRWLRKHERWYLSGLRCFVVRQVEAKVSSGSMAMAWICALMAVGICLMVAGLAFSVGMRVQDASSAGTLSMAPIGFVGILYGATFLLAAAAILALQQLSEAADNAGRYRTLYDVGVPEGLAVRALRTQVGVYFGAPLVGALLHAVFGLAVVGFLAYALGAGSFVAIVAATLGGTLAFVGLYYGVTCAVCRRSIVRATFAR